MSLDQDSERKISEFLRSVYRLKKMKDSHMPEQLTVMEKAIMGDRLESLSVEEVYLAIVSWEKYYEASVVEEEIEDEKIMRDVNTQMLSLN